MRLPCFSRSFAVEFDIFDNAPDISDSLFFPFYEHVMVAQNADFTSVPAGGGAGGHLKIDSLAPTIADGAWRHLQISWDCGTDTLKVWNISDPAPSGKPQLSCRVPLSIFLTPWAVNWGFTGATGSNCTTQQIKDPTITTGIMCGGGGADTCGRVDTITAHYAGRDTVTGNCMFDFTAIVNPTLPYNKVVSYTWATTCPTVTVTHPGPATTDTWFGADICSGPGSFLTLTVTFEDSTSPPPPLHRTCSVEIFKSVSCNGGISWRPSSLDMNNSGRISVYPNPAAGYINVDCSSDILGASYRVIDIHGKELLHGTISSSSEHVLTEALAPGMYILGINKEGIPPQNIKFTKQ